MAKVFAILAIFAAVAAVSLSIPRGLNDLESMDVDDLASAIGDQKVGIPTDELMRALGEQDESMGRGANFFNLSAYLNPPGRNPNITGLTFVPLITLLLGIIQGAG